MALDLTTARAVSRKSLAGWITAGASFERALGKLLGQARGEVRTGRPPSKVVKKVIDQLSQLMNRSGLPGEIRETGGRHHEIAICIPEAVGETVTFVLVSVSLNGRNGAINLTCQRALDASKHVLERLHQRLGTKDSVAVLREVYSCLVVAAAMDEAAQAVGAQHWPLVTTSGLFVCAPAEGDKATVLVTWMRLDQLGQKWGRVADDLRAASSENTRLLEDRDFCAELLRLHSWLLHPHAPGPDLVAIWWASRPVSEQDEAVREFERSLAEQDVDSAMQTHDEADWASDSGGFESGSADYVSVIASRPHAVKAREQYTGIVVQLRWTGARIVALQNGFFGVLRRADTAVQDLPAAVQLGARITVEVLRVFGEHYTGPHSIVLHLPDVANAVWSAVQQLYQIGSIVSGTLVWRGGGGSVIELNDRASGWLPDTELTWSSDNSSASEQITIGQTMSLRVVAYLHEHRRLQLSLRQAGPEVDWSAVKISYPLDLIAELRIRSRRRRGFEVSVDQSMEVYDVSGWLPDSEVNWPIGDRTIQKALLVGQKLRLKVIGYSEDERRILFSKRQLEAPPADWSTIASKHPAGTVVEGSIAWRGNNGSIIAITDGVAGWLHDSELSWSRTDRSFRDTLRVGQTMRLAVIGQTPERRTLTLSLRRLEGNPLDKVDEDIFVGATHSGVVVNVTYFGAFIRLPIGIDGLIHRIEMPDDLSLSKGDVVDVLILAFDKQSCRISLRYVGPSN